MKYELRFRNHGGHTFSVSHMTARSDLQAIAYARRIYRCGIGNHYEIWRDKVLVHTELQDSRLALRSLT